MKFTEAEAKAKVGHWVRVRDAAVVCERLAQGTLGEVVDAHLHHREAEGGKEEVWVICILFFLLRDHAVRLLCHDIGKEVYERAVEEIEPRNERFGNSTAGSVSFPPFAKIARWSYTTSFL